MQKVEIPVPTPKKGEVLVKVEAVSINLVDWRIQNGVMRPLYPKFPCVPCKLYFLFSPVLDFQIEDSTSENWYMLSVIQMASVSSIIFLHGNSLLNFNKNSVVELFLETLV